MERLLVGQAGPETQQLIPLSAGTVEQAGQQEMVEVAVHLAQLLEQLLYLRFSWAAGAVPLVLALMVGMVETAQMELQVQGQAVPGQAVAVAAVGMALLLAEQRELEELALVQTETLEAREHRLLLHQ